MAVSSGQDIFHVSFFISHLHCEFSSVQRGDKEKGGKLSLSAFSAYCSLPPASCLPPPDLDAKMTHSTV